jgi:hypothetical protein
MISPPERFSISPSATKSERLRASEIWSVGGAGVTGVGEPEQTVILTHGYWQRRFGAAPSIVGRNITMDGQPRSVIGVMPQGFRFLDQHVDAIYPDRLNRSQACDSRRARFRLALAVGS